MGDLLKCKHKSFWKGNQNMLFTTQNITSKTPQGSYHMKYTKLCNEEKRAKPSTPRYLTTRPHQKNQTNINKESNLVKMSQPHFETSVKMKLTFPKVGTWSPLRLPKIQSLIAGVKITHIDVFFIPLETS
jgi:hypothetical protein